MQNQAKDLFQLQTELVEAKVDMAVAKAIDRVLDRIDGLHKDIGSLQKDIDTRFLSLREDMSAVKTKLGMVDEVKSAFRVRLMDFFFKAAWVASVIGGSFLIAHAHGYFSHFT